MEFVVLNSPVLPSFVRNILPLFSVTKMKLSYEDLEQILSELKSAETREEKIHILKALVIPSEENLTKNLKAHFVQFLKTLLPPENIPEVPGESAVSDDDEEEEDDRDEDNDDEEEDKKEDNAHGANDNNNDDASDDAEEEDEFYFYSDDSDDVEDAEDDENNLILLLAALVENRRWRAKSLLQLCCLEANLPKYVLAEKVHIEDNRRAQSIEEYIGITERYVRSIFRYS